MILVSEGAKRHTREAETRFRVVVKFQDGWGSRICVDLTCLLQKTGMKLYLTSQHNKWQHVLLK